MIHKNFINNINVNFGSRKVIILLVVFSSMVTQGLLAQLPDYVNDLITEIHTTTSDSIKGYNYIRVSQFYLKRDIDKANVYIDSARSLSVFRNSSLGKGLILMMEGTVKMRQKKNDEGLDLFQKAKDQFLIINDNKQLNKVEYEIATFHLGAGDYEHANESFLNCIKYANETNDTLSEAKATTALGVIQRRLGNLDEAYDYYASALPIYIQFKHKGGHSTTLLNMAIIEKQRKNFSQSKELYGQALELAQNEDPVNMSLLSYVYGNMSSLFDETKDYYKAIEYGEKALDIRKKSSTHEELASSYVGLSINYYHINKYNKALSYLKLAESGVQGNENLLYQITKTKSDIFFKQGKYNRAYLLLAESNSYKDSIYNADKNKQIAEINTKYESELKEAEIKELELEEQINKTKINQQKIAIGGLALGLGIVSMLGYFLYTQKNKISLQNKEIRKSAEEKDVLLREIHHRVKNNLQVISSLLGIQGRSIRDKKAKEALQEGRNRVQSMSLIHQNLYKKDNLTGIEMKPYIDKLSNHLLQTYHVDEGNIEVYSKVDDISLDVETVVPIGLIINELITNSLKYAFPNGRNGKITIELYEQNDTLIMSVSDDGIGLNPDQLQSKTDSFGHSLISAFKNKLDATIDISGDNGTEVKMEIKNYKKVV